MFQRLFGGLFFESARLISGKELGLIIGMNSGLCFEGIASQKIRRYIQEYHAIGVKLSNATVKHDDMKPKTSPTVFTGKLALQVYEHTLTT